MLKRLQLKAALGVAVLVLSGCASHPEYYYVPEQDPGRDLKPEIEPERPIPGAEASQSKPESQQPVDPEEHYSYVEPQPDVSGQRSGGVESLVRRSEQSIGGQHYEEAVALLERALRIAPNDADLYYRLASVRLQQGDPVQAEQLARRGLSLSRDEQLHDDLEDLITRAQAAKGDAG